MRRSVSWFLGGSMVLLVMIAVYWVLPIGLRKVKTVLAATVSAVGVPDTANRDHGATRLEPEAERTRSAEGEPLVWQGDISVNTVRGKRSQVGSIERLVITIGVDNETVAAVRRSVGRIGPDCAILSESGETGPTVFALSSSVSYDSKLGRWHIAVTGKDIRVNLIDRRSASATSLRGSVSDRGDNCDQEEMVYNLTRQ